MKAYVIKNKEGEFYIESICKGMFSPYIQSATIYYDKIECSEEIEEKCLKDVKVVPITIYEGDPLELACEKISSWEMNMPKDKMKDYFIQQAKEMKENDAR